MPKRAAPVHEEVLVHPASPALRPWLPCAIGRRVHGASGQAPLQAWIHANTYACLNVITKGGVQAAGAGLPASFLTGPFSAPVETSVATGVESFSLVLQPWLLPALAGLQADAMAGRLVDTASIAHPVLDRLCAGLRAAGEGAIALEAVWSQLRPLVLAVQPPALAVELLRAQGVQAAALRLGCSERHYRRQFARHMGLGPAAWLRIRRWEDAVQDLADGASALPLAELSAHAGYADQAHMSRDVRAFARQSPAQLQRLLGRGKGQWALQAARVRLVQDR